MTKKINTKRLVLTSSTIRILDAGKLAIAVGGAQSGGTEVSCGGCARATVTVTYPPTE